MPGMKSEDSAAYIDTKTLYICTYPDCGQKFTLKQNLLAHQTKKHGRVPKSTGRTKSADDSALDDMINLGPDGFGMGELGLDGFGMG